MGLGGIVLVRQVLKPCRLAARTHEALGSSMQASEKFLALCALCRDVLFCAVLCCAVLSPV